MLDLFICEMYVTFDFFCVFMEGFDNNLSCYCIKTRHLILYYCNALFVFKKRWRKKLAVMNVIPATVLIVTFWNQNHVLPFNILLWQRGCFFASRDMFLT